MDVDDRGLLKGEAEVIDLLVEAYNAFLALDRQHPDELRDFIDPLRRIQDLVAMRVVRRAYPEGWPVYRYDKKSKSWKRECDDRSRRSAKVAIEE